MDRTYEGSGVTVDREQISVSRDIGIVTQCLDECTRRGDDCLSVTLLNERGGRQRCFSLAASATEDGGDTEVETGVAYYEKICTRRICRRQWTFTRVPGLEYVGEGNEELTDVRSLAECRNLCLESSFYECRSATYYADLRLCKLSEETRRSSPQDFLSAGPGVDYMENECSDRKDIAN